MALHICYPQCGIVINESGRVRLVTRDVSAFDVGGDIVANLVGAQAIIVLFSGSEFVVYYLVRYLCGVIAIWPHCV